MKNLLFKVLWSLSASQLAFEGGLRKRNFSQFQFTGKEGELS